MTPLSSTSPSDIANAARCFATCAGGSSQASIKTYLLTQVGNIATPPCITPTAPILSQGAKVITNTTLRISWNQLSNSGSLITSYTVFWGTSSGVYTNSAVVPVIPRIYTITGLSSGTQYFFAVQANSSAAVGCQSALSNEANATTTGASPSNPLLTGLVSWWKMDEAAGNPRADSIGTNTLTENAAIPNTTGIIVNELNLTGGGLNKWLLSASNATLQCGAGVSKSFSLWFFPTTITISMAILGKWSDAGADREYILFISGGNFTFRVRNLANAANVDVTSTYQVHNPPLAYVHIAFGYDDANQVIWISVDGETKVTTACTGVRASGVQFRIGSVVDLNSLGTTAVDGFIDEVSMWSRALTQSEIYQLASGYSLPGIQANITAGADNANRYNTKVVSNGGAALAANSITGLGTIIDALITQGVYIGCVLNNFSDNLTACLTGWSRTGGAATILTNDNFVAGDVGINGLTGNGVNKDIVLYQLNLVITNANSASVLRYVYNCPNTVGGVEDGCLDVGANGINFAANLANVSYARIGGPNNLINGAGGIAPNLGNGCYIDTRTDANTHKLYFANSTTPFAQAGPTDAVANPGTVPTTNITLFAQRFNNVIGNWSSATMSFWIMFGTGLSSAQAQAIYNAVQSGLVTRGGGFR